MAFLRKIIWGDGLEVTDEGGGVVRVDGTGGATGATGAAGATGATGATGAAGPGVPTGGTTAQVLKKASATNYDTVWGDESDPALATHLADTTDAHDATAVSIADAGLYFTATDVEAALQEIGAGGIGGGGGGTVIEWNETPAGTINGVNDTFTLAEEPDPADSLSLFKNGVLQDAGVDYTLVTDTVTFAAGSIPLTGDVLLASYQTAVAIVGTAADITFTPAGTIAATDVQAAIEEVAAEAGGGTSELDYVEYNAGDIAVSGSSGTPTNLLSGAAVTYDGSTRVKIEFWAAGAFAGSAALIIELYDGGSLLDRIFQTNSALGAPAYGVVFRTPTAGSHTFHIKAWKNGGTDGAIAAAATYAPIFMRITTA
jgi:hypothetical protein